MIVFFFVVVGLIQIFLFSQVKSPVDPDNYVVFQDILLIGQVCLKYTCWIIVKTF